MRRKSNAKLLFWPTLAAIAVILVLLGTSRFQDWLGLNLYRPSIAIDTQQTSDAIPSPLPPPTPLSANDAASKKIAHDLGIPQDSRSIESVGSRLNDVDTNAMLAPPANDAPVFTLMAPVLDDEQELAGLTPDDNQLDDGNFGRTVSTRGTEPLFAAADRTNNSQFGDLNATLNDRDLENAEQADFLLGGDGRKVPETKNESAYDPYSLELGSPQQSSESELTQPSRSADINQAELDSAVSGTQLESKPAGVAWPRTPALEIDLSQLQELAAKLDSSELSQWIQSVRSTLLDLQAIPSITDSRAGILIAQLRTLAEQGIKFGETQVAEREIQAKTLRASYALLRRTNIWNAVWSVGEQSTNQIVSLRIRDTDSPLPAVEALQQRVAETGDPEGWARYLMLTEIAEAATKPDAGNRRLIAQRLLSRIDRSGLSEQHREWLQHDSVRTLTSRIRSWADAPVDYASLLAQLERQESDALDMGAIDVATAVQNLRFSDNDKAANVASAINDYYRNANLRLAVSADLLRQLLPDVPAKTTDIRQTLVGMPVRGTGVINSQLGLQLLPTEGAWNLMLNTDGVISARTGTSQWPVQITNRSNSQFSAATPIRIDRHNIIVGETNVSVASRTKLQNMQTEFDGFPVIESLVRAIAMSRYEESAPVARRQSEAITRRQVSEQIGDGVETQINQASDKLASRLLGPLGRLQLDPLVVDLDTTESRLTTRYRVAGDWQLAAFTPRPRALANSVLSMQIHQSLLNNTFEQLLPSESPQPIREMMARVLGIFGVNPERIPGELPENVHIRFASTRPVTVEIEDGLLWLTLRVVRLHDNEGLDLNYFVVRAAFRPEFDGLNARLVREGVVQISGPRMGIRERLPVRAIFTKVLADERPLPLVSEELVQHPVAENLRVGMLELVDGWLCLAICPNDNSVQESSVIAKESEQTVR